MFSKATTGVVSTTMNENRETQGISYEFLPVLIYRGINMYWFSKSSRKVNLLLWLLVAFILFATWLLASDTYAATFSQVSNKAAKFDGQNAYVTFGDTPELGLPEFTLELWFKWDGGGITTSTGVNGIEAYPLIAKGRAEAAQSLVDMNYFLGIEGTKHVLVADLAEGANGYLPGSNHPIFGVTPLVENEWYHAAATYDGRQWQLFLNGQLEAWIIVEEPANTASKQHASLATALNAVGEPEGYFAGTLDEVRIWDMALNKEALREHINTELVDPQPHLVARWALDDAAAGIVTDSAGLALEGTAVATKSTFVNGAPFNLAPNDAPNMPILVQPADTAVDVSTSPTLEVTVNDPETEPLTVSFYGRPLTASSDDFTLIALPDTQKYAASSSRYYIFNAQTQWIVDSKAARNIAHVTQLGDCVDDGGSTNQWDAADTAFSFLEDPATTGLPDGISYSIAVGNKDQSPSDDPDGDSTALYNQYFGISRFSGRSYYGGYYGSNFDNHYELFSASGMDFILISLEYGGSTQAVLDWTDNLLATYSDRRAIVVTHYMINTNGSFSSQGQDIYNALKDRPNLFLLHGGHKPGEGSREDTYNGHKVHSLLADYQSRTNGGDGWLRILEFSPNHNEIRVKTYSPTLDQFETDSDSEFTLDYEMLQSAALADFQLIGEVTNVASGTNASVTWSNLDYSTAYEWYVTVNDGSGTTTGEYWQFTTAAQPAAPQANFIADVTSGDAPLAVSFTDLSSHAPTSWSWDFGDGGTSSAQNPSHTYDTPGTYSVSLTVSNGVGSDLLTRTDYIEVSAPPVPLAYFTQTAYVVNESGGPTVTVNVALTQSSSAPLTVNYATGDDTAVAPGDYTATSGSLIFAPDETSKSFSVQIIDDASAEPPESLDLTLSGDAVTEPSSATITINDDDPLPEIRFSRAAFTVGEDGSSAEIQVELSYAFQEPITVDYNSQDNTAVAGQDYSSISGSLTFLPGETSHTLTVPILTDTLDEEDETLGMHLHNPQNASIGNPDTLTITILDNDAPPQLDFNGAAFTIAENGGVATLTVQLNTASGREVTVDYMASGGTAVPDSDFQPGSGTLTFAPGQISRTFMVQGLDDNIDESNETAAFTLSNADNAVIGSGNTATVTITDDDSTPVVQFNAAVFTANEVDSSAFLTVTLIGVTAQTITVDYATNDGTAVAGSDYTAVNGTLTFSPGEQSKTITVNLLNDTLDEPQESLTIQLHSPVNAIVSSQNEAAVTIEDDDAPVAAAFVQAAYVQGEESGSAVIEVTLSAVSGQMVTVDYATIDGTAVADSDYTAVNGRLSFAPGETSKTILVPLLNDDQNENDETFFVSLTQPIHADLGVNAAAILTIVDNDDFMMFIPLLMRGS